MIVWMIWMQEERGEYVWLEAAWTDDQTIGNAGGWKDEVDRCRKLAYEEKYEMRLQRVGVRGVVELFDVPESTAA